MPEKIDAVYPIKYEKEILLKDGSRMMLRPIRRDDIEPWLAFISRLSTHTKYLRFHGLPKLTEDDAIRFCTVDYHITFAFVAEVIEDQKLKIIAIGRYYRLPDKNSAELALVIEDAYQGKGIGTKLMEWLANVARENGIVTFEADVLSENIEMMAVLRDYGFHVTTELEGGVYHVRFPLSPTKKMFRKEEERERASTVASLHSLLFPKSIAVIGASTKPETIGYLLFKCVMENGFSGVVYPINPNVEAVQSVRAYPSILDVPGDVDLAVIAVRAQLVSKVVDECGRMGVRTIIVISDGFKERGHDGAIRERELRDVALGYGMRLVGPNCMGVINTDSTISLNASFSQVFPPPGNIAFLSQSGALGLAILDYAKELNLGISTFVSVGNRADISANDLLQFWEEDPATRVILLYLESFGNPRRFVSIARRVSRKKPIIVVKSGTSLTGSRAASSHTGALATPEIAIGALFRQAGMIRVNTLEELFDVASLLSYQPLPNGKRVAIVTNGGGPGILAADACEAQGLILPEFSSKTINEIKSLLKRDVGINNPLDLTAGAGEKEFSCVLKYLASEKDIDSVILIFVPPVVVSPKTMEDVIRDVAPVFLQNRKPLLACFMGQRGFKTKLEFKEKFVPSYRFPERAVLALSRAARYSEWLKKPKGADPKISGIKRARARKIIGKAMTQTSKRPFWLSTQDITELLDCYGIRFAESIISKKATDAARTASRIGFPVVLKLASSTLVHKTDVGGVKLDLNSEDDVEKAFNDIKAGLEEIDRLNEMDGVIVQRMVKDGIEAIVGVTQDPSFGPLIMFGLGGIYAELMKDVAVSLHPLTDLDVHELVNSIKMSSLFKGYRGSQPSDAKALEDLLLRLSTMIEDFPQINELDFNPVKVLTQGEGCWVVDARILVK